MRSATPFFDSALYRKTMARFWPLWAGWTLLLVFFMPLQMLAEYLNGVKEDLGADLLLREAMQLPEQVEYVMAALLLILSVLCAMAAFSYLCNNRSACMMHALPMRREKLFGTQYLAGLSMMLLPVLAVSVLTLLVELAFLPSETWGQVLPQLGLWLLAVLALMVSFYSIAVFCAMFTGHILAIPVFYGVVNFVVIGLYGLIDVLCTMFLYGFASLPNRNWAVKCSPFLALSGASHWVERLEHGVVVDQGFSSPETMGVYVVLGLILSVLALLIYRRRHVESAGDVVAVPLVRPLFRVCVALGCGLCLGTFSGALLNFDRHQARGFLALMVVLWTMVGYLLAEMLLKKSVRVFKGCWKGAAAVTAVTVLLCAGCYFDWMGVQTRVPEADRVAVLTADVSLGAPVDVGSELAYHSTEADDPNSMNKKLVALHQAIVDDFEKNGWDSESQRFADDRVSVILTYELDNGHTLRRSYYLPIFEVDSGKTGTLANALEEFMADREVARSAYNFDRYADRTPVAVELRNVKWIDGQPNDALGDERLESLSGAQRTALWEAMRQDFEEGNLGTRWAFVNSDERYANTYQTDLVFHFQNEKPDTHITSEGAEDVSYDELFTITLTPQAVHTLALLEEYGAFEDCRLAAWQTQKG